MPSIALPSATTSRFNAPLLWMALLAATCGSAAAAEVQIGVTATAIDIGLDFVSNSASVIAGPVQGTPPMASLHAAAATGIVASNAFVAADAYTGQMHAAFSSTVNIDENPRPGRGGSARGGGSMLGGITLTGAAPPGVATFSAVVEGSYNFGNSIFRFNNSAHIDFSGSIGDVYHGVPAVDFDPFSSAGLFSFPLTWTVPVQSGQRLDMIFTLNGRVTSTVTGVVVDMTNTFKLTAIDLPPGYGFVPDAQGFLSQFPAPVPEPGSGLLLLAGGLVVVWRWHRGRGAPR